MEGTISDEQAHIWLQDIADGSWVSLHFESPALGATGLAEIGGGGYARPKVAFSQPTGRIVWSLEDARFNGLLQTKLTYFGVWDQPVRGMLRAFAPLEEPKIIVNGSGYILHEGDLAISIG